MTFILPTLLYVKVRDNKRLGRDFLATNESVCGPASKRTLRFLNLDAQPAKSEGEGEGFGENYGSPLLVQSVEIQGDMPRIGLPVRTPLYSLLHSAWRITDQRCHDLPRHATRQHTVPHPPSSPRPSQRNKTCFSERCQHSVVKLSSFRQRSA